MPDDVQVHLCGLQRMVWFSTLLYLLLALTLTATAFLARPQKKR